MDRMTSDSLMTIASKVLLSWILCQPGTMLLSVTPTEKNNEMQELSPNYV